MSGPSEMSYFGQPKFLSPANLLQFFTPRPFLEQTKRKFKFLKKTNIQPYGILKKPFFSLIFSYKKNYFLKKISNNYFKKKMEKFNF